MWFLTLATAHSGWLPRGRSRGCYGAWPLHPPSLSSSPLATPDGSLRGTAESGTWRGSYTLAASHPCQWPLRMAPFQEPQRVVLGVAPSTLQSSQPLPLASQEGSLGGAAEGDIGRGPYTLQAKSLPRSLHPTQPTQHRVLRRFLSAIQLGLPCLPCLPPVHCAPPQRGSPR